MSAQKGKQNQRLVCLVLGARALFPSAEGQDTEIRCGHLRKLVRLWF